MATRRLPRVAFDGRVMTEDVAAKGWTPQELARRTNGEVHKRAVYRFLSNQVQTVTTATVSAKSWAAPATTERLARFVRGAVH
jgi:hypothetical protein